MVEDTEQEQTPSNDKELSTPFHQKEKSEWIVTLTRPN